MSAKYKSPSFLLPNELNTSANTANDTGINSLYSMKFDGSSQYITMSNPAELTDDFTIAAWIFPTRVNDGYEMIYTQGTAVSTVAPYFAVLDTRLHVYITGTYETGLNFITANEWQHVAVTRTSGVLNLYRNGVEYNGTRPTQNGTINNNSDGVIGKWYDSSHYFKGQIDEVAIFNRALNTTEIAALYDGTGSNIRPSNLMATNLNPIAYYPLGEQAQMQGYLGNEASSEWQFPNGVLQDYVMDFDGSNKINLGNSIGDIGNSPMSFSFWVNFAATSQIQTVLSNINSANDNGWKIEFSANATSILFQNRDTGTFISCSYNLYDVWTNIIIVRNGTANNKIYINGQLQTLNINTENLTNIVSTDDLVIGSQYYNNAYYRYFNGQMSNIVIWNSDQSANIANIYNNGSPQTTYTVTPQNWWKLNADSVYTPSAPNYTTALNFNGSSNYVDSNKTIQSNLDFSVSIWINPNASDLQILGTREEATGASSSKGFILQTNSSNEIRARLFTTTSTITEISGGTVSTGVWSQVAMTYVSSSKVLKIYVNGTEVGSVTGTVIPVVSPDNLNIGRAGVGGLYHYFNGSISNVAIYNSALTATQVTTLFNFGTPETAISFSSQAWWKLNDQNAITDYSGNGNTGTNNGATDISSGVAVIPSWKIPTALPIPSINYTTALDFNGSSDYIRVDNFSGVSSSFSVSLWFNLGTSALAQRNFLELMNPSTANLNQRIFISSAGTIIASQNSGAGGAAQLSTSGINDGEWHHLYATISSNGSIKVILDNNSTASGSSSQSFSSAPSTVNIGVNFYDQSDPTAKRQYFLGQMSNVAVYNSALTDSQVATLYNSGQPESAISLSPVGWWKLDTGGSTITDYGSGGNNGTNNGTTQATSDVITSGFNIPVNGVSTTLPSTALQQSDLQFDSPYSSYSLSFDGVDDYIDCTDNDMFSFGNGTTDLPFSVSFWAKLNSVSGTQPFLSKDTTSPNREWAISIFSDSSNGVRIFLKNQGGDSQQSIDSSTALTTGVWYHITTTYDGRGGSDAADGLSIYINGSLDTPTNISKGTYTAMSNTTAPVYIGKYSSSEINGKIDETAIWNTALTEAQVLEIYNNGRPKDLTTFSGTAPISWWRLGENAYFNTGTTPGPEFTVPNSIAGAPNGIGSGTVTTMLSADAPGTYANGIGTNLDIIDRVGDASLSVANSQSYNMIPDDKVPYVPGYVGAQTNNVYSMTFDGVDDYFNTSFSGLNGVSETTISIWAKTSNVTLGRFLYGNRDSSSPFPGLACQTWTDGNIYFYVNSLSYLYFNMASYGIQNDKWFNIVFVYNGSGSNNSEKVKIYVDGNIVGYSINGNFPSSLQTTLNPLTIGLDQSANSYWNGLIDEVAIFDKALTADQIKFDLYSATTAGKTADIENNTNLPTPVAWYRMGD